MDNAPFYDEQVAACAPWSHKIGAGERLRIIDLEGQQAVDTLLYAADQPQFERYCAQTTVREQGSPYIRKGSLLYSNRGRVLAEVIEDTCGYHDTSAGACSREANTVRFGHHTRYMHACRENFLIALAPHGLDARDMVSNINFFMNVPIKPNGDLAIVDGVSQPGDYVELKAMTDILVMISNCPQINNPCNGFEPTPIRTQIWAAS